MSQTTHLIANNIPAPGFGPADSRSLPCSGVSRRVSAFSSGSYLGEHSLLTRVTFISHKRVSKAASVLCGARSGNNRRNSEFSNQGFSTNRNWLNGDRDNSNGSPDEYDFSASKNGTISSSASSNAQANAKPGQKEKQIVELFKKVQAKLRERTAGKEVKKAETAKGEDNEEIMDSIFSVLRNKSIGEGGEKISASNNGIPAFRQRATSGPQSEGRSWKPSLSNITPEPKATPVKRPKSSFRGRSPVPSVKYQPIYNSDDDDDDLGEKQQPELDEQSKSDEELESEQDLGPEPVSSLDDEYISAVVAEGELSEEETSLDDVDQQPTEHEDLNSLKLAELRALAKSRGVKGFSKIKKSDLVELLSGS